MPFRHGTGMVPVIIIFGRKVPVINLMPAMQGCVKCSTKAVLYQLPVNYRNFPGELQSESGLRSPPVLGGSCPQSHPWAGCQP